MLNIISLSALREKITWPGKVVKNLMKGLDILGYPYTLNGDLNSTKRLWIHDDISALPFLSELNKDVKTIIWPNLFSLPKSIPKNLQLENFPYIMPCQWIVRLWKDLWYIWIFDVWPVWISTYEFHSSNSDSKIEVLIYIKKRFPEEKNTVMKTLNSKGIKYECIEYWSYKEQDLKNFLRKAKYVIWIGCPETQWIALQEILASDVPILVWDVRFLWQWKPISKNDMSLFTQEESSYQNVTSAEYFDDTCGKKIFISEELSEAIDFMEQNLNIFSPRKYILEHLSLAWQARAFLELYNIHYGLTFEDGMNEKILPWMRQSFRNKLLWKNIFRIYDSWFVSKIRKLIQ